jgi:hypothetical protein
VGVSASGLAGVVLGIIPLTEPAAALIAEHSVNAIAQHRAQSHAEKPLPQEMFANSPRFRGTPFR